MYLLKFRGAAWTQIQYIELHDLHLSSQVFLWLHSWCITKMARGFGQINPNWLYFNIVHLSLSPKSDPFSMNKQLQNQEGHSTLFFAGECRWVVAVMRYPLGGWFWEGGGGGWRLFITPRKKKAFHTEQIDGLSTALRNNRRPTSFTLQNFPYNVVLVHFYNSFPTWTDGYRSVSVPQDNTVKNSYYRCLWRRFPSSRRFSPDTKNITKYNSSCN